MGWYIKKSKSVGPLRFNLSKSGIGMSAGVKGARVSFGPRGTYINLGRNGIYYREKIGGGKESRASKKGSTNNAGSARLQYNYGKESSLCEDAIKVSRNSYSESILGQKVIGNINKARLVSCFCIIASVILIYLLKEAGFLLSFFTFIPFSVLHSTKLDYELDDEAELEWEKIAEIIYGMRASKRIWLIESTSYNANTKNHSGASQSISRVDATVKLVKAKRNSGFRVKTNVPVVLIKSKKCKILFLPSGVLVKKGLVYVAYSYEQINLSASTINFIESGSIARDAEVIKRTWQYVNRNGSPDGRFKNNKQLPVCLYGSLSIKGNNINIELLTSNKTVTKNVENALRYYSEYIRRIENSSCIPNAVNSNITKQVADTSSISNEERKLLEETNDELRELGRNGYAEALERELSCSVHFIDGQLYQGHALFLYKASETVSKDLKTVEHKFNANLSCISEFKVVNDKEFLVHLYLSGFENFKRETSLSDVLRNAVDSSNNNHYETEKTHLGTTEDDNSTIDEILTSGVNLFSASNETEPREEKDSYASLFVLEDNETQKITKVKENKQDDINDLMGFFDEE